MSKVGQSVSVSDKAFGREYNEALVHQVVTAVLSGARQARMRRKPVPTSAAVASNRGNRRGQVVRELVPSAARYGGAVA